MAPVIRALRECSWARVRVCATAQHRGLLDSMLSVFELSPDFDLDIMRPAQSPNQVLERVIRGVDRVLEGARPDLVLVQGDTTTVLGAALAAFHRRIAVGHVEAGLRTGDLTNPFPEEANRALTDRISDLLFAPTRSARANLLREGLPARGIFVTGNTSIDALLWAAGRDHGFHDPAIRALAHKPLAVITLHRRENFGAPLSRAFTAIRRAADDLPEVTWVYPVHPNPNVSGPARRLLRHPRIRLTRPLDYLDFVHLLKRARFIVTDSGGVQEEAPSLGKAVVVVREKTERGEAIGHGSVLAGTSQKGISSAIRRAADAKVAPPRVNPFGDGKAGRRIAAAIRAWAGRRT
jgi:UDP-N-acetylglucosamine 2-epimerase (non-hydrolysing)